MIEGRWQASRRQAGAMVMATLLGLAVPFVNLVVMHLVLSSAVSSFVDVEAELLDEGRGGAPVIYFLDREGELQRISPGSAAFTVREVCGVPSLANSTTTTRPALAATTTVLRPAGATAPTETTRRPPTPSVPATDATGGGCIETVRVRYDADRPWRVTIPGKNDNALLVFAVLEAVILGGAGIVLSYTPVRQYLGLSRLRNETDPATEVWYAQIWSQHHEASGASPGHYTAMTGLFPAPPTAEDEPVCVVKLAETPTIDVGTGPFEGAVFAARVWGRPSVGGWMLIGIGSSTILPRTPGRAASYTYDRPKNPEALAVREVPTGDDLEARCRAADQPAGRSRITAIALGGIAVAGLLTSWAIAPAAAVTGTDITAAVVLSFVAMVVGFVAVVLAGRSPRRSDRDRAITARSGLPPPPAPPATERA